MKKLLIALGALLPLSLLANTITVYNQPQANAKIVGQIHTSSNIKPIFQKNGWIEVVNKNTGQTGWIMQSQPKAATNTYQQQYQNMLNLVRQEQAQLTKQFKQAQAYFMAKMRALKQKEAKLLSRIQSSSNNTVPMTKLIPATKNASSARQQYVAQSTTITCNGKRGTKITKKIWTDASGKKHLITKKTLVTCQ